MQDIQISGQEIEKIFEEFLKQKGAEILKGMIEEHVLVSEQRLKELSLLERVIRVEEELKALRQIEAERFEAMDKRFEAMQREMDKRFEAMDKRFEAMQREMDKRFGFMQWFMGIGFSTIVILMSLFRFLH